MAYGDGRDGDHLCSYCGNYECGLTLIGSGKVPHEQTTPEVVLARGRFSPNEQTEQATPELV